MDWFSLVCARANVLVFKDSNQICHILGSFKRFEIDEIDEEKERKILRS